MDEVEYQKRRSQKITGYDCDCDHFAILHPPEKVNTLSWGWGVEMVS